MESSVNKSRTPSRCREWERNRRNKFNDAISRLGEIVKEINRTNIGSKDTETVQYPKVEIVEKAIVCLTSSIQEKTQLKAEILALQVKMETEKKQKENKKDVSTQVFIGISKKSKNDKCVKVLMLQKTKRKALREKSITKNVTVDCKIDNNVVRSVIKDSKQKSPPKLPTLKPKANVNDKKGPENTIVVLPAAPYIFPQRPLLLPTVPPTFVLVNQNLQTLNKPSFPIVNRTNSDITKTTMVNILPISAYSRPLSATKIRKSSKAKIDSNKKPKKSKPVSKSKDQLTVSILESKAKPPNELEIQNKEKESTKEINSEPSKEINSVEKINEICKTSVEELKTNKNNNNFTIKKGTDTIIPKIIGNTDKENTSRPVQDAELPKVIKSPKCTEAIIIEKPNVQLNKTSTVNTDEKSKTNKPPTEEKEPLNKDKENKLPNILTTLCESGVDGGNARLELAEEFLAASPTAAFLMSFPLVSGNRADSPAEETPNPLQINPKDNSQKRNDISTHSLPYFEKSNPSDVKSKPSDKPLTSSNNIINKPNTQLKYVDSGSVTKSDSAKISNMTTATNVSNENPFLNLSMSSLLPTTCTLSDSTFGVDFDCNISKSMPSQSTNYVSNSNIFYKSDPFSTVKSTIYSTSSISSGHEFNSFGLYPCAMEKYTTKNKTDYSNVEDNLMKIGSSRLTYDIDLGWSHKGFDFVNCTCTANTFNKDNIVTTATGPYSTSFNPFNPDFHVPLVSNSTKKENTSSKPSSSFSEAITSFYSQPTNLWSEDMPFYTNSNASKTLTSRQQNYLPIDHTQMNFKQNSAKQYEPKQYEPKQIGATGVENVIKPLHSGAIQQVTEKFKKSPSKMHINWMTSEVRPMQTTCNPTHTDMKDTHKLPYSQLDHTAKKQDHSQNNYFPISMHNFPTQPIQEEIWSSTRPAGTTEISIEPPPINLPTLVGDLALGPHDKKKIADVSNRVAPQTDIQNCSNFFSVTQLMNRSTDNHVPSRYQGPSLDTQKAISAKQNIGHVTTDTNRKGITHTESHVPQPCYVFNDPKPINSYDNMNQFQQSKVKSNKSDKTSKTQKNSYSAEALIRGGTCNPKLQDNSSAKFMIPSQKYNDFNNPQDTSIAQVSHFPPILDYSDNSYAGQQFSGTNLYNTTTNTISNSFYSNFMSGSTNLMPGNYTAGPFSSDFMDYNQTPECSYPNHKYSELKMRNNPTMFQQEKIPSNYKSSRRESAAKHKLECSKKDSSKKCQSKRPKLNNEVEDWSDTSHLLWQNKATSKRHPNLMSDELPFPNYVGNQMATGQYQPDFFNSHIMSSNMQPVGHNMDRSLATFPATSRANFNLSTIFPEITMKVQ